MADIDVRCLNEAAVVAKSNTLNLLPFLCMKKERIGVPSIKKSVSYVDSFTYLEYSTFALIMGKTMYALLTLIDTL